MKHILNKNKYRIILLVFIIGLLSSLALSLESLKEICSPEKGCNSVQNSQYALTFGIKNSNYGILIFSLLIIITVMHMYNPTKNKRKIINLSIVLGALIALYFIYLQKFVLKSYCKYCIVVDLSLLFGLLLLLLTYQDLLAFTNLEYAQEPDKPYTFIYGS